MGSTPHSFSKEERLCSKLVIDQLFAEKKSCFVHPFRYVYLKNPIVHSDYPCQVLFSVPKRNFKRAVKRNLIKRRMRESFRLNKQPFYNALKDNDFRIALMVIYIGKDETEYSAIDKAIRKGLTKILEIV